jgi:hypothetical protein
MEAAGTMNRIAVGVIRGVCDYGNEHKNKIWQPYAAAMAAAYAKAVLSEIRPRKTEIHRTTPQGGDGSAGRADGPVFNGPISGRNVVAGQSTSGGTTNMTFT